MPTIADVAKACGISKATVSLVINNSALKVSPKTRARVIRMVQEMNYQPSAHARSLSTQRANMIGVVTKRHPHLLSHVYYGALIDAIVEAAADSDQTVAVFNGRIWRDEEHSQTVFGDGRCDGVLILMAEFDAHLTRALQKAHVPFVTVNGAVNVEGVNSIDIDNVEAGYTMTRYLINHGHRRVACLHTADPFAVERLAGYRKALDQSGIEYDENLVVVGHYSADVSGYVRARQIIGNRSLGVTAIFAATDGLACDAIQGIQDMGLCVPDDVSVVGINDTNDAVLSKPPLTTLRQSVESIGAEAVRLLLELVADPTHEARQLVWPAQIVERESVAPPSTNAIYLRQRSQEELKEITQ